MKMREKVFFTLLASLTLSSAPAMAGEFHHGHYNHARFDWQLRGGNAAGLPVFVPGVGTYSGGIGASYIPGTGLFISVEPGILAAAGKNSNIAPKAKIITVSQSENNGACSMEAGVCVIRADRP